MDVLLINGSVHKCVYKTVRDRRLHKTLRSFDPDNFIHVSTSLQNLMHVFSLESLL